MRGAREQLHVYLSYRRNSCISRKDDCTYLQGFRRYILPARSPAKLKGVQAAGTGIISPSDILKDADDNAYRTRHHDAAFGTNCSTNVAYRHIVCVSFPKRQKHGTTNASIQATLR